MESQDRDVTLQSALSEAREHRRRLESAESLGLDLNRLRFARYL